MNEIDKAILRGIKSGIVKGLKDCEVGETIFGYFDAPDQLVPNYDPGLNMPCPLCLRPIGRSNICTVSLMPVGGARSYFYRMHALCRDGASEKEISEIEGQLIDVDD